MSELATPVPAKMDEFMEKIRRGGVAQIIRIVIVVFYL